MIQSDHNIVINKRFVNPKLLIPIILIFIPLLVSGSDSLLTFSIHKRGGGGRWLQKKNVEKLLRKPEMVETMLQRKRTKKRKEKEQLRDFGL